jgi:RNA polymerase sigma factor (sigma-70 family)
MFHPVLSTAKMHINSPPKAPVSSKLLDACRKGERKAQKELYQSYYNPLLAVCLRYSADQSIAKGLLNQAFLKIFQSLSTLKDDVAFWVWAKRLTINVCLDHLRKQPSKPNLSIDQISEPVTMASILDHYDAEEILGLVQQLPATSRAVFSLNIIEGYKHSEIAEQLGMSVSTSRWHLSFARTELKRMLQNQKI